MEHGAKSIVLKGQSETACHAISKEKGTVLFFDLSCLSGLSG